MGLSFLFVMGNAMFVDNEIKNSKLLIVDDNQANLKLLAIIFDEAGWKNWVTVSDSSQVLNVAHKFKPDLICLDLLMPPPDGFQILKEIRKADGPVPIPVVILTIQNDPKNRLKALKYGANDFITKPFDATEALTRVRNQIKVYKVNQALYEKVQVLEEKEQINELFRTQQNLEESFGDFDRRIHERTKELEIKNFDLEKEIQERKTAEQKLLKAKELFEKSNQAKSEFLSRMSHELRTPLNAIMGFCQVMENDLKDPLTENQNRNLSYISNAGKHLLELINEILDLTRIESGKINISIETVEIFPLMKEVLDALDPLAQSRQIKFNFSKEYNDKIFVLADRLRLRQILFNLISNAIKYNLDNETVTVTLEKYNRDYAMIKVHDNGLGIPTEKIPFLFEPFERLGAEATEVEGSGIGLAISKRLIELMEGSIFVESKVGKGSCFGFTIPLGNKPRIEESDITSKQNFPSNGQLEKKQSVLYIEDNSVDIALVKNIVSQQSDLKLFSYSQVKEGLQLARTHKPDLILMDIHLKDMNGFEALSYLKSFEETFSIPVIAVTANAMEDEIEKGLSLGFAAYITKPFHINEFLETIYSTLNKSLKV